LLDLLPETPPRGEVVLVIDRNRDAAPEQSLEEALQAALETMTVKDAAAAVAEALGLPKRQAYQKALDLAKR
jgi:16S rRNA (cytidine1402-2'-O)-methyltransferase